LTTRPETNFVIVSDSIPELTNRLMLTITRTNSHTKILPMFLSSTLSLLNRMPLVGSKHTLLYLHHLVMDQIYILDFVNHVVHIQLLLNLKPQFIIKFIIAYQPCSTQQVLKYPKYPNTPHLI